MPDGVRIRRLDSHVDARGRFTEVFRASWQTAVEPVQWNVVRSAANVLRGVHVHLRHADYLTVIAGTAVVKLCDLRPGSPTALKRSTVELDASSLRALSIPPGVAHGFYFPEDALHVYAVSEYWDPADELGCHYADPELGFDWPCDAPLLSERDAGLGELSELLPLVGG